MMKVTKHACILDMRLGRNGTFIAGNQYWSRQTKGGTGILMLSEEGHWIKVMEYKMTTRLQPIAYFMFIDRFFVNDKRELNAFIQKELTSKWLEELGL
ncbi:TPA: hypothetical protein ACORDH_002801 [Bacillus cereus]